MAKKEPYDMTNNYARMERDKRKAIGNPNKNIHHKKNGSNYQKDTGSMVRSTSARQEPEKMSTTMKVLIGVVFVALVAAHRVEGERGGRCMDDGAGGGRVRPHVLRPQALSRQAQGGRHHGYRDLRPADPVLRGVCGHGRHGAGGHE